MKTVVRGMMVKGMKKGFSQLDSSDKHSSDKTSALRRRRGRRISFGLGLDR
jgi:hypothetical protein